MVALSSPDAPAIPLSIDPVIGWRLWGIEWDGRGGLVLTSPMREYRWDPMQPSRAQCHVVHRQRVPVAGCSCGLYAVSRLEHLPRAVGLGSNFLFGVVGSVAMWGQVVEHAAGYRGQIAYPDRLRLICRHCFLAGRDGVPTRIEHVDQSNPEPVCEAHATSGRSDRCRVSPDELQQMLLSTYAVDLLPVQTLHEAGYREGPMPPAGLLGAARSEVRQLARTSAGGFAIALLVAAYLVLRALGLFATPGVPQEAPVASPVEVPAVLPAYIVEATPSELADPEPEPAERPVWGGVCGHRTGAAVELLACGRGRAELFGSYSAPAQSRRACDLGTAYSRKPSFSVCWFDLFGSPGSPIEPLRLPGVHLDDLTT